METRRRAHERRIGDRIVQLTTLVRPGCPIEPDAHRVHGISDDIVADAPLFRDVLPDLLRFTAGRTLLAYNAAYDHAIPNPRWVFIMQARSDWLGRSDHRYPLRGNHRALGDALAALNLLKLIANETLLPSSSGGMDPADQPPLHDRGEQGERPGTKLLGASNR